MSEGRPRDLERDRRIVEATRVLLDEGGLSAVTVTAVARRAGVGRPTVYRRYANAEDLAMAVLYADLSLIMHAQRDLVLVPADPLESLITIAAAPLRYYAANLERSRSLLQLSLFAPDPWSERFAAQAQAFIVSVVTALQQSQDCGALEPDVDVLCTAQVFYGLYLSTAIGACSGRMGTVDDQLRLLRGVLRQHLRGLTPV